MATITVNPAGSPTYDYDNLEDAITNASTGDTITISGSWTSYEIATTPIVISLANLTIEAVGNSKFDPADRNGNHYRLEDTDDHVIEFTGTGALTLKGFELKQNSNIGSAEGIRVATDGTLNVDDMFIWSSDNTSDQDGIYSYHAFSPTINVTNSILFNWERVGIHYQIYSNGGQSGKTMTINVNSSTLYRCGISDTQDGAISISNSNVTANNLLQTRVINVQNSLVHSEDEIAIAYQSSVGDRVSDANTTINIGNTLVSDSSDGAVGITSFTGGADNVTFADTAPTGTGDEVYFESVSWSASSKPDLRIKSHANNDAQDLHADATEHGLTIPSTDIAGTSRPQNTNYDVGAFEIVAGGSTYTLISNQGSFNLNGQISNLKFNHLISAAQGSYTLSGQTANLEHSYNLVSESNTFNIAGQITNLFSNKLIGCDQETFNLNGQNATLIYSQANAPILSQPIAYNISSTEAIVGCTVTFN